MASRMAADAAAAAPAMEHPADDLSLSQDVESAHRDGAAAPVVLASTHERALQIVPLEILRPYSVDVPADAGALDE